MLPLPRLRCGLGHFTAFGLGKDAFYQAQASKQKLVLKNPLSVISRHAQSLPSITGDSKRSCMLEIVETADQIPESTTTIIGIQCALLTLSIKSLEHHFLNYRFAIVYHYLSRLKLTSTSVRGSSKGLI